MNIERSTVQLLAGAADAAYGSEAQIKDWAKSKGLSATMFHGPASETEGFTTHDGKMLIVAFRGTSSRRDWETNLHAGLPEDDIHAGFHAGVNEVWSAIVAAVKEAGNRKIWITGHSLGGALAVIAASKLIAPFEGVVTFGQPRAGGKLFAQRCQTAFGDRHLRVINDQDAVPRVPPFTGGFRHSGGAERIGGKQNGIFESRVETTEDAVRLFTGHDVEIPVAFEDLLIPLERHVNQVVEGASGGIQLLQRFGQMVEPLLSSDLTRLLGSFDDAVNKTARAYKTPGIKQLNEHKMAEYFKSLGLNPEQTH